MKIAADHKYLQYSGRINFEDQSAPEFVFPCSYVRMRFRGAAVKVIVRNQNNYWDNYLGVIIDGQQRKIKLSNEGEMQILELMADGEIKGMECPASGEMQEALLSDEREQIHDLLLFKRQDACHMFKFYGFVIEGEAEILPPPEKPQRRIEVYGDSVSAGEVSEALEFAGKEDPVHDGEYSNSWYSYAWMTARKLNAELHDIAQGGIALLDHTGWFCEPDYVGMETAYNKILYNPAFGRIKSWDFDSYRPHVVIVAIGQNDNHPIDYMKEDYNCRQAIHWRAHYKQFIEKLREIYPDAEIVLATTILAHDEAWDRSIEQICQELADKKVHHFLYTKNGTGTPGHVRIPEAEQMAEELSAFINSLGKRIWE